MGGTRFVGRYLVANLLAKGHKISLFTRGNQPIPKDVEHIKGDRFKTSFRTNVYIARDVPQEFRGSKTNILGVSDYYQAPGSASSSSVYGIKEEKDVHEDISLQPLTDYSKYKVECENIVKKYVSENFTPIIIRPATVCGYSPRQRLDVIVNILNYLLIKYF